MGGAIAPAAIGFLISATGTFAAGFTFMVGALAVASVCILVLLSFLPSLSAESGEAVSSRAAVPS
jgi:hypothetical protein